MRVWIYGLDECDVRSMRSHCLSPADTVVGVSIQTGVPCHFPHAGLLRPTEAAIRGEIDQLLVSDFLSLEGRFEEIFQSYGVSVKSADVTHACSVAG